MTIKEIAKLAGVSISTVSKVMNHKDASISPETREKVLRIAKEFNYSPYSNIYAAASSSKAFTIGVLVRDAQKSPFLPGIINTANELGYITLVYESADDSIQELRAITAFCRSGVGGVLWEPISAASLNHAAGFHAAKIPYLLFNNPKQEDAVNINLEQVGYDAAFKLVQAHHTNIACLISPDAHAEYVLNGYRRCLFDMGIPYQESLVFHNTQDGLIRKIAGHHVTGVVCSSYALANKLYGELHALHIQIPYDVSLVALQDDFQAANSFPEISTFIIPHLHFGKHLCKQLIARIEQPNHPLQPFDTCTKLNSTSTISVPFSYRSQPLLVVGSINIDNYLKMDRLPSTGKSTMTSASSIYPGGKAINQAIGISKLGAHAAVIGTIGNDMDSDLIFETLKNHSVDSSGIRRCNDAATGKAYIFVQRDGDSLISILSGANSLLMPDDINEHRRFFKNCSYCLIQTEIPLETVMTTCKLARAHQITTILKPSSCNSLPDELFRYVNILVPNHDEINLLCPEGTLSEKADHLLALGIDTVIVTLGAEGCYLKTNQLETYIPAIPFQSVDNTGACDAFISALAVYLQDGYPLEQAVHIASYAAAFSITREGVPNALVDRNTLEAYIRQKEPHLLAQQ